MKTSTRILLILIIFTILNLITIRIYALDINMNLTTNQTTSQATNQASNQINTSTEQQYSHTANNVNQNTSTNTQPSNQEDYAPRVTSVTTSENDSFLKAENIMSIIIIVIGILLVFLGVAILVKFK